jgi:hypothetical protein
MHKSFFKLYLTTFLLILTLSSFAFAGEGQCPYIPPPPPTDGGRSSATVVNTINPTDDNAYQVLTGIWEFLSQNTDLF